MIQSVVDFLLNFASAFWSSTRETAPFLILGLVLAGFLHVLVSSKIIMWVLGGQGLWSSIKGALLGAPLPLCSCSVMPTALTLRKNGASLSATTSFLISTPETSIDAIAITLALMPLAFFGIRPIAAIFLAVSVGLIVEYVAKNKNESLKRNIKKFSDNTNQKSKNWDEICRICGLSTKKKNHKHGIFSRIKAMLHYAFIEAFNDIGLWIFFGLIVGAFLQEFVPATALQSSFWVRHQNLQIILAIFVGIPLYSCATATTPIAAALLLKGLSPGATLALLLTGPATNIGSILILKKELGKKYTYTYLVSIAGLCWLMGLFLNYIYPKLPQHLTSMNSNSKAHSYFDQVIPGWVEVLSAWLILFLILKIIYMKYYNAKFKALKHYDDHNHSH